MFDNLSRCVNLSYPREHCPHHVCPKFSMISERITRPDPAITSERVNLPPGTSRGIFEDSDDDPEYRSDHDIAAGRIPNSTNTVE